MLSREAATAALLEERLSLTAFVAMITRSYHLAEDVFQDICMKCLTREEEFESREHLLNWARLSGRNRAISLLRVREGKYDGLSPEMLESLSAAWPDTWRGQVRERQELLAKCLEKLTVNNREILRLRYFEGRSGTAVAEELGRKLPTVHQALARIHKSLRECVQTQLAVWEGRT
ncbi:sigma-70 family RNA polymerase sigma factor [Planctomicrobium sp. SH664]|uniref:sigma-70 family RNA polymerase sigma factor n=1 Tax=Planctomicrobium sp. SH664 TaxID=3448125 RepID=UPI003F5C1CD8